MINAIDNRETEISLCRALLRDNRFIDLDITSIFEASIPIDKISNFATQRIGKALKLDRLLERNYIFQMKLRLAMHLSPKEAIEYDSKNPISRDELIKKYLETNFTLCSQTADSFARELAVVLRNYDLSRKSTRHHMDVLLARQVYKCASCNLDFQDDSRVTLEEEKGEEGTDLFKPYYYGEGPSFWMLPEVDHIEPVSGFGSNTLDNLQVLCALCNRGKDDGFGVKIVNERKYAADDIFRIPHAHRIRMFYYRLEMDDYTCTMCKNKKELTVRKIHEDGGFLLSNVYSVCYDCLGEK